MVPIFTRKKTVNITVSNTTDVALAVKATVTDKNGFPKEERSLGRLESNDQTKTIFKLNPGSQYGYKASLPGSADVDQDSRTLTKDDPKIVNALFTINAGWSSIPDNAVDALTAVFESLGPNINYGAVDVGTALESIFGGLLIYDNPQPGQPINVRFQRSPAQIGNSITTLKDLRWPSGNKKSSTLISQTGILKVSGSIPFVGSMGFDYSDSDVFKLNWTMNDYGPVDKVDQSGWSPSKAIKELKGADRGALCSAIEHTPKPEMIYVNRLYVIRSGFFELEKARKYTTGGSITNVIVEGSTAWTFENAQKRTHIVNERLLAISGQKLNIKWRPATPTMGGGVYIDVSPLGEETFIPASVANKVLSVRQKDTD